MPEETSLGPARAAAGATLLTLVAIAIAALWRIDYLPTHDGPQHIYTIHAANHLSDPANGYSRHLEQGHPVTSYGFYVLFAPLDLILPWKDATRIALSGMVLLWIFGCVVLARSLHRERIWLGIALAGASFQWSLYMGLFSFHIATSFGLWILAFAIARRSWGTRDRLLLAMLLVLQAVMHVFPAVLTAGCIGLVALARSPREKWPRELGLGLAMAAPVLGLLCGLLAVASDNVVFHDRAGSGFTLTWPPLWTLAKCFMGGPGWRAWPLLVLALFAPWFIWLGSRRGEGSDGGEGSQRGQGTLDLVFAGAGVIALVCAIAFPLHIAVWDLFSVRFLPLAMTLLILAIPFESIQPIGLRHAAAAALALFSLASTGWALQYNVELDERSRESLAGLEADLDRTGARIAIVMDPFLGRPLEDRDAPFPFAVPMLNLGQLYSTEQGGVPADTFAISPPTHHVLFRREGATFPAYPSRSYPILLAAPENRGDQELRKKITTYVASRASEFEDVILWGEPEDAELLIARGFTPDWHHEGLMLARFEGCPFAVEIDQENGPASLPPGSVIEMGWYPLLEVAKRLVVSPGAHPLERVPIANTPCGSIWLRVRATTGNPGDGPGHLRVCHGADAEGRLILADTRRAPVLRCRLVALDDPRSELHTAAGAFRTR